MIVHDAATAFVAIINAAILWAQLVGAAAAFVLCVVAFAVGPLVVPRVKTAARRLPGTSWARGRLRARMFARRHARRSQKRTRPRWAHSQPVDHDYEECA